MLPFLASFVMLATAPPDTLVVPLKEVVVSATKSPRNPIDVANGTAVVSGTELRRRATQTVAEALQDVVGLDTGEGSDNGSRLPNLGLWGLKEFDAMLVTLDGVPVGGPFNPSLAQLPMFDLDRIEVVKGPQGTLYGVSAFAGMIQAFSRVDEARSGHLTLGGGSFSDLSGTGGMQWRLEQNHALRLSGTALRSDGWQDRTASDVERGDLNLTSQVGSGTIGVNAFALRDQQSWGTPLPYEGGVRVEDFVVDRNYAVGGAKVEHRVFGAITSASFPIAHGVKLQNTLSYTQDDQTSIRSFLGELSVTGDSVASEGVSLEPREQSLYEDAHLILNLVAAGKHELIGGGAVTWGRTDAHGIGFDFDQTLADYPDIPSLGDIPVGDHRSFNDRRTFVGAYVHDDWTPIERITVAGGSRYDNVSEELSASFEEVGNPLEQSNDSKTTAAWSGDASLLVRAAPALDWLQAANVYVNYKSAFKPAAPNLTEAEDAEILEPEWTHSIEGGFKGRALDQFALDLSVFQMDFQNMVVPIDMGGTPGLTNAGQERFKGFEAEGRWSPRRLAGTSLMVGYAHHDARFVEFVSDEGGTLEDVSGNHLEQVPEDLVNVKAEYAPARGLGGFVASRYRGERFFARDNAEKLPAYTEWDAGATLGWGPASLVVAGRNLGDSRHVVTESEIGPDQVYIAPPRRFVAHVTYQF